MGVVFLIVIIVIAVWVLASCVRIVPQAYAVILERLGAYQATWSTGIHFKVPVISFMLLTVQDLHVRQDIMRDVRLLLMRRVWSLQTLTERMQMRRRSVYMHRYMQTERMVWAGKS